MLRIFTRVCALFYALNIKRRLTPDISSGIYPLTFHQSALVTIHGLGSGFLAIVLESAGQLFQVFTMYNPTT